MRGRLSFALTALTLLFLLQGWAALLASLFATVYDAIFPSFRAAALLPVLLPIAALCAPLAPVQRRLQRRGALAASAVAAAVARIPLSLPAHEYRLVASAAVVAAAAVFLAAAVGYLERRSVAGGVGAAITLDQLLRLSGWSWDLSMRAWWVLPQVAITATAVLSAVLWLRLPEPADDESSLERRAGGLRLRGGVLLAVLLFLDLNVLARPEIALRWVGVRYEVAAVLLVCVTAAATMLLLAGQGPIGRGRRAALGLLAAAALGVLLTPHVGGVPGLVLLATGHAAAVLLIGRALVPAGGRRGGITVTIALAVLLLANALYAFTFFYAFTLPVMRGAAPWVFGTLVLLAAGVLALLPRPLESRPRIRRKVWVALSLVTAAATAGLLAVRERPPRSDEPIGDSLRVATYNVHYGFDQHWRYDPAGMVDALRAARVDVVALQEVGAAMPTAYGTDLALYLGRRLGMRIHFAPAINGLLGDALLSRVPVGSFAHTGLPPVDADRKVAARLEVPTAAGDTLLVVGTHLGLVPREQSAQAAALLDFIGPHSPVVLLGDLNVQDHDAVLARLRHAGFRDAFDLARAAPPPTFPADAPAERIDWILLRGASADDAAVSESRASDHRLVTATVRLLRR